VFSCLPRVRNANLVFVPTGLYPGIIFTTPTHPSVMGADAVGILLSPSSHPLYSQPVLVSSAVNWIADPIAPEGPAQFGILGATSVTEGRGTFAEYLVVGEGDVVECPKHFRERGRDGWSEAAAVPLGGLTAYR
jgi:NADPH:quinone reductase-like Zn-dependent oxidoreductase